MKAYFEGRPEKIITEGHGSYRMMIRYFANSNKAQVTMERISELRFPIIWSICATDEQANAALELFKAIGFFDIAPNEV